MARDSAPSGETLWFDQDCMEQGRLPRDLYGIRLRYRNTKGRMANWFMVCQRKSDADQLVERIEKNGLGSNDEIIRLKGRIEWEEAA